MKNNEVLKTKISFKEFINNPKIIYLVLIIIFYLILLRNILKIILPTGTGVVYNLYNPLPGWFVFILYIIISIFIIKSWHLIKYDFGYINHKKERNNLKKLIIKYLLFLLEMLVVLWISFYIISNYNVEGKIFHIISVIIGGFMFFFLSREILSKFNQ